MSQQSAGRIRPNWPFQVNWDSPQAQGLIYWAPLGIGAEQELVANLNLVNVAGAKMVPDEVFGTARQFVAASVQYYTAAIPPIVTPLTLAAYFKPVAAGVSHRILEVNVTDSNNCWLLAPISDNKLYAYTIAGGLNSQAVTTVSWSAGVWNHCCGRYGGATERSVFLNGANKVTEATSRVPVGATNTLRIGYDGVTATNGNMVDVRVYNRALSDLEIFAYFRDPSLSFDLYWKPSPRTHFLPMR